MANIDYREQNVLSLTLYDPAQSQTPEASINADMVREGLATVNTKVRYARGNQATLKKLQEALEEAKKERVCCGPLVYYCYLNIFLSLKYTRMLGFLTDCFMRHSFMASTIIVEYV